MYPVGKNIRGMNSGSCKITCVLGLNSKPIKTLNERTEHMSILDLCCSTMSNLCALGRPLRTPT